MSNRRKPTAPQHVVDGADDEEPIPVEPEAPAEPFTVGRQEFADVVTGGGAEAAVTHLAELLREHGTIRVSDAILYGEDEHGRFLAAWVPDGLDITDPDEHGSVYVTRTSQEKTA